MIKINTTEFYDETNNEEPSQENVVDETPIENGACANCEFFYVTKSVYSETEGCNHPENVHYTYNHKGKHAHIIWEPRDKNKSLDCNFFVKRKPMLQKIKIKLGLK